MQDRSLANWMTGSSVKEFRHTPPPPVRAPGGGAEETVADATGLQRGKLQEARERPEIPHEHLGPHFLLQ